MRFSQKKKGPPHRAAQKAITANRRARPARPGIRPGCLFPVPNGHEEDDGTPTSIWGRRAAPRQRAADTTPKGGTPCLFGRPPAEDDVSERGIARTVEMELVRSHQSASLFVPS